MYIRHAAKIDYSKARIVITDHLLLRLSQYTRLGNVTINFLRKVLGAGIDPTEKQIRDYFQYTDNRNKVIVYSPLFKLFFVMKFDGPELIIMTCVKERNK